MEKNIYIDFYHKMNTEFALTKNARCLERCNTRAIKGRQMY